jgi:uncharacterized protein
MRMTFTRFAGFGVLAWVLFVVGLLLVPHEARAFTPPSPQGAVTDTSGRLTAEDDQILEQHIAAFRSRTSHQLAVLVVGSLGDETVDDIAYTTFNAWGVGKKGDDNGVLLVVAPNERKMRIETGKGVGDRLTDLESSHILRERVGPLLKQDRFRDAILAGLTGIEGALDTGTAPSPAAPASKHGGMSSFGWFLLFGLGFGLLLVLDGIFGRARRTSRWNPSRSSSTWTSSNDSWSGGSSSSDSWSGGSSGGSDFGGGGGGSDFGGGSSGGGGSSDSY